MPTCSLATIILCSLIGELVRHAARGVARARAGEVRAVEGADETGVEPQPMGDLEIVTAQRLAQLCFQRFAFAKISRQLPELGAQGE